MNFTKPTSTISSEIANNYNGDSIKDVKCQPSRSIRYLSDGQCSPLHPIEEPLCSGFCISNEFSNNYNNIYANTLNKVLL